MICIVSCEHYPDDERIYHREIQTLVNNKIHITYFSRSESDIDLSDQFVSHINYQKSSFSTDAYQKDLLRIFSENRPMILHIHEPDLLPLAKMVIFSSFFMYMGKKTKIVLVFRVKVK